MVAKKWRKANVRIKMKLQEEAEEDELGNDNLNGLERSDQSPQTEYFPWRGRRLRGMR